MSAAKTEEWPKFMENSPSLSNRAYAKKFAITRLFISLENKAKSRTVMGYLLKNKIRNIVIKGGQAVPRALPFISIRDMV